MQYEEAITLVRNEFTFTHKLILTTPMTTSTVLNKKCVLLYFFVLLCRIVEVCVRNRLKEFLKKKISVTR